MSKRQFNLNISPVEALDIVKNHVDADLIHEETIDLGNNHFIGTLVFEKYYMRVSNRVALIVIIDNTRDITNVRVISTGSSQGMIFSFDWGASDDFTYSVEELLNEYIID
ncbi:DUF6054 family protein [Wukongibacter baidiensis]|uniref:DUF6054 family protein n=1 Tax=Wukongibacter baidiensis TaxID=1723361 RepID=UPI003D7F3500